MRNPQFYLGQRVRCTVRNAPMPYRHTGTITFALNLGAQGWWLEVDYTARARMRENEVTPL